MTFLGGLMAKFWLAGPYGVRWGGGGSNQIFGHLSLVKSQPGLFEHLHLTDPVCTQQFRLSLSSRSCSMNAAASR